MENFTLKFIEAIVALIAVSCAPILIYNLNRKKEEEKVTKVKNLLEELVSENNYYTTPLFNNAGFVVGLLFFWGLGFSGIVLSWGNWGNIFPSGLFMMALGFLFMWFVPYIRISSQNIEFQPLFTKLFGLNFSKKVLNYNEIKKITKESRVPPFILMKIYTDSKIFKFNMFGFNSEIGNGIYDFLKQKLRI